MGPPRTVRIPRARPAPAPTDPGPAARENGAGRRRARRLFALFAGALAVLYVVFVGLSAAAAGGLSAASDGLLVFTLLAGLFVLWAWTITLRRAPLAVRFAPAALVVRESRGRTRVYPLAPALERTVVERYPASPLAPEPTELVRVGESGGRQRLYLVARGLFDAPTGGA